MSSADVRKTARYKHRATKIGLKVDGTNVADLLDLLDDDPRRDAAVGVPPSAPRRCRVKR